MPNLSRILRLVYEIVEKSGFLTSYILFFSHGRGQDPSRRRATVFCRASGPDQRDVNDSKIKFEGKTTANIEKDGTKETIGATHNNQTNTPITRAGLDGKTGNHVTHRQ